MKILNKVAPGEFFFGSLSFELKKVEFLEFEQCLVVVARLSRGFDSSFESKEPLLRSLRSTRTYKCRQCTRVLRCRRREPERATSTFLRKGESKDA